MTIRIDTFRRQLTALIGLVELVRDNADDLHVLATTRPRGVGVKVRGGTPDYALDTHGDPRARQLLHDIEQRTLDAVAPLHQAAADASNYLNTGTRGGRRDPTADATATEILDALAAQQRRRARGEHAPTALVDQPTIHTPDPHAELELLRSVVRKLDAGTVCDAHKEPRTIRQRARLTPAEQDAIRRAHGVPTSRRKKARRRAS